MEIDPKEATDINQSNEVKREDKQRFWSDNNHPVRRLLVFQVKLAVDAFRDIALSPVAFVATLLDLFENRRGKARYFEKVLQFGRISERNINLFEQHKRAGRTVDNVLDNLEEILANEFKKGDLSAKAKSAIEKKLKIKMRNDK